MGLADRLSLFVAGRVLLARRFLLVADMREGGCLTHLIVLRRDGGSLVLADRPPWAPGYLADLAGAQRAVGQELASVLLLGAVDKAEHALLCNAPFAGLTELSPATLPVLRGLLSCGLAANLPDGACPV